MAKNDPEKDSSASTEKTEVSLEQSVARCVKKSQKDEPLNYEDVLGLLLSPICGAKHHGTLELLISDLNQLLIYITVHDRYPVEFPPDTLPFTLALLLTVLNNLAPLHIDKDHLWHLANQNKIKNLWRLNADERDSLLKNY